MHDRARRDRILLALVIVTSTATSVRADTLRVSADRFDLLGMHDSRQLIVTLEASDGKPRDVTREATYQVAPAGVVRVTLQGYVRPAGKGEATITIESGSLKTTVAVMVKDFDETRPLNFSNDIVPLLTRHGCNARGCHGKASGQNGFKLSLFGHAPP